jgi:formylglycine-generating enzyme required for sulfatase activity
MMPSTLTTRSRRALAWTLVLAALVGAAWLWFAAGRQAGQRAQSERLQCALAPEPSGSPHPGMVWVPAGSVDFGDDVYPEELPVRRTAVGGFWIDRTEVTNDAFARFVDATGYVTVAERPVDPQLFPGLPPGMQAPGAVVFVMPNAVRGTGDVTQWWRYVEGANWRHPGGPTTSITGRGSFPVVTITYADALAYATWNGRSLPSELQWEHAARAGQNAGAPDHAAPAPGAANTWQGLFPVVNSADDGFVGLAPVGCFAPSPAGLFDMVGNAWELTADIYRPSHAPQADTGAPDQPPPGMRAASPVQRVIKGGSFLCASSYCRRYRAGARQPQDEDLGTSHLGFRTILVAPGP